MSEDPREPGWGMVPREPDRAPFRWDRTTDQEPTRPEFAQRVMQAAAKGQVALLVTDAAGVVIVGIKGTGGMTKLEYKASEGIWEAHVYLSGVTVLDGSYLLRAPFGYDPDDGDVMSDEQAEALANRALERHRHQPVLPYPEGES